MTVSRFKRIATTLAALLVCALGHFGSDFIKTVCGAETGAPPVNNNLGDSATAAELGVDIYPGAQQSTRAVRMKVTGEHFITVKFVTSDSLEKVLTFYKSKLGPHVLTSYHMGDAIVSRGNKSSKEMVQVTIVPNSHVDNGRTQITILHNTKD